MCTVYWCNIFIQNLQRPRPRLSSIQAQEVWLRFFLWNMQNIYPLKEGGWRFLALCPPVNCWKVPNSGHQSMGPSSANTMAQGINSISQKYYFRELNSFLAHNKKPASLCSLSPLFHCRIEGVTPITTLLKLGGRQELWIPGLWQHWIHCHSNSLISCAQDTPVFSLHQHSSKLTSMFQCSLISQPFPQIKRWDRGFPVYSAHQSESQALISNSYLNVLTMNKTAGKVGFVCSSVLK